MADYENLLDSIDAVIRSNNRREITGQILQNTLHQMVGSLGENYQLAGFATPTLDPNSPDQNVFYITDEAGVYTNFDNITLGAGLSFLMWKNEEWTSKTLDIVTAGWLDEHYVSKAFLRKVFQFFDEDGVEIFPNDTESVVDNIKAMCGLWTNEYLSALGLGEGSTIPTTLAALNDVTITDPQDGQALVYDLASNHWVNATIQSGVDMSVVWAALAAATNEQINISHLTTALNDYVTATSLATTLQSYVTTSALATELASYASQSWVETNYVSKVFFNSLFEAQDVNGNAITPNNSGQTTIDRLKILVGAYTEQYLSALGLSSGGGGGGSSTLAGLNDVTITNPQDGQALIYDAQSSHWVNGAAISMSAVWTALAAATSEQINSSHLTSALSGYVTTSALASELANYVTTSSLATTLADYVTTSALATTLADYGSKTWVESNYISKAFFNRLFRAFAPVAEGESEAAQVEPNDVTTEIDNIKAMFGFWTEQYLSALGLSAGGGHTIGVLNDLNDVTITNPQTNQVLKYNGTQWVNAAAPSGATALSGLTDVAISSLADKELLQWDYATGKWKNVVLSTAMSAYALASSIPTNVSQLNNDSGFITGITSSMVTAALGYTPANSSSLSNYLPLSGGTLTSSNTVNTPTLRINNTSPSAGAYFYWSQSSRLTNMVTGAHYINIIGKAESYYNAAWFGYFHSADDSSSNYAAIGLYGVNDIIVANGAGNVGIGNTAPSYKLHVNGSTYADSFIKKNGTSAQFLKADGSVDSNSYVTSSGVTSVATGTGLTGGTITSTGTISIDSTYQSYISHGESAYNSLANYLPLSGGTMTGIINMQKGNSQLRFLDSSSSILGYVNWSDNAFGKYIELWNYQQNRGIWIGDMDTTAPIYYDGNAGTQNKIWHSGMTSATMNVGSYPTSTGALNVNATYAESWSYPIMCLASGQSSGQRVCFCLGRNFSQYNVAILNFYYSSLSSSSNYFSIGLHSQNDIITGNGAGNVGIGTGSPAYKLHVAGDIYATGGVTALSDARHKTIVEDTRLQVSDIARMRAVRYLWNDGRKDNDMHVGSIAQDWQQILPEVVLRANNDEGTLSLQYGVAALISSITIARKVVNHEQRIAELEKECERLRTENEQLKLKIA